MRTAILSLCALLCGLHLFAQDTYSIVAVDTGTGEVGSAGASCLDESVIAGGVSIIGDVIPAKGAINTQSFYLSGNQTNARARMLAGDSPQQIIQFLINFDVGSGPAQRQYGIAAFDSSGGALTAAYTGANCLDVKYHVTGYDYAIQGNILLDSAVIDSMEAAFLRTAGQPLEHRLMAAMLAAKKPGADSRCLPYGMSSLSAYLRVAKPTDGLGLPPSLDLVVPAVPGDYSVDPIDSLYTLFLAATDTSGNDTSTFVEELLPMPAINTQPHAWEIFLADNQEGHWQLFDLDGRLIDAGSWIDPRVTILKPDSPRAVYILFMESEGLFRSIRLSGK